MIDAEFPTSENSGGTLDSGAQPEKGSFSI